MPSYTQYMRQMAVLDAKDDDIESWITVKGNHIPIKKGQSKEDAVKSFIAGKKKNLVENHNSLVEAMNLEEKGYFKKDPRKRDSITQSAIEMGKEEKNLEELMEFGVKEANAAKPEPKYDPEFEVVRKNALANPNLYGGKYTQKSKAEAYKEYKKDTSSKENLKKANAFVNSEHIDKSGNKGGSGEKKTEPKEKMGNNARGYGKPEHYAHKWESALAPHNLTNKELEDKLALYRSVRVSRPDDNELIDKINDIKQVLELRKK